MSFNKFSALENVICLQDTIYLGGKFVINQQARNE